MKIALIPAAMTIAATMAIADAAEPIRMVDIPAGYFYMGSRALGEDFDEGPVHKVTISTPFKMSATEITNAQYEEFFPEHRALRGGTYTLYNTGDRFPDSCHKAHRDFDPVSLRTASFAPDAFGLYDMHGNVEEWCLDRYALYPDMPLTDPCGPEEGELRVTRGGSHHTPVKYLRSANRSAMLPSDRHSQTGFRIVESAATLRPSGKGLTTPAPRADISTEAYTWMKPSEEALYIPPVPFVIEPACGSGTPFYSHNHQPAVTWCDNGDLLAIWFSANEENGRKVTVLSSQLKAGTSGWEEAREFFRVPDRNLTGSALLNYGKGRLLHINGMEASGDWQNLAMVARESRDGGVTWEDRWDGAPLPDFKEGGSGSTIAGIHAGVVQLSDGSLMALGRGNSIPGPDGKPRMPMSISHDMGRTWSYHASELPPIDGGQRLMLRRLNEGPLLLVSFTDHPQHTPEADRGMEFTMPDGSVAKGYGMYAAVSFDEGRTWPVRRLVTDGEARFLDGGAWTGFFESDASHAEPRGYLCATQTPDNVIHLLSSRLHYRFNLPWLLGK